MYRATGSGSDCVPFMAPDYKKAPTGGGIPPWYRVKAKSAGLLKLICFCQQRMTESVRSGPSDFINQWLQCALSGP